MSEPPAAPRRSLAASLKHWRLRSADASASRPSASPKPRRTLTATLREWHKRAGIGAFAFILWLAASGILLTRSANLGFDTLHVDWPWLMALYGLHAEAPQSGFHVGGHWLVPTNDYTVLDGKALDSPIKNPLGLIVGGSADQPQLFVGSPDSVVLLGADGHRIDELRAPILPIASVRRIGAIPGATPGSPLKLVIQDFDAYQSTDEGETWTPLAAAQLTQVQWSQAARLPEDQSSKLIGYAKPRVLVEQLLIDLHSGRLFGPVGAWVITIVGAAALWLASSGIWMWVRISRARGKQGKQNKR